MKEIDQLHKSPKALAKEISDFILDNQLCRCVCIGESVINDNAKSITINLQDRDKVWYARQIVRDL